MTDVLNSSPSKIAKEASRCNERGLTRRLVGIELGLKK